MNGLIYIKVNDSLLPVDEEGNVLSNSDEWESLVKVCPCSAVLYNDTKRVNALLVSAPTDRGDSDLYKLINIVYLESESDSSASALYYLINNIKVKSLNWFYSGTSVKGSSAESYLYKRNPTVIALGTVDSGSSYSAANGETNYEVYKLLYESLNKNNLDNTIITYSNTGSGYTASTNRFISKFSCYSENSYGYNMTKAIGFNSMKFALDSVTSKNYSVSVFYSVLSINYNSNTDTYTLYLKEN